MDNPFLRFHEMHQQPSQSCYRWRDRQSYTPNWLHYLLWLCVCARLV